MKFGLKLLCVFGSVLFMGINVHAEEINNSINTNIENQVTQNKDDVNNLNKDEDKSNIPSNNDSTNTPSNMDELKSIDDEKQEPIILSDDKVKDKKDKNTWDYVKSHLKKKGNNYYFEQDGKPVNNLIDILGNNWFNSIPVKIVIDKYKSYGNIFAYNEKTKKYDIAIYSFICSNGPSTPIIEKELSHGGAKTYRWHDLYYGYYGQFCTRIEGHILFHSVLYKGRNKNTLDASSYNDLGKTKSHGCVRLKVSDAKLIQDHVYKKKTIVKIASKPELPLQKPVLKKIPLNTKVAPEDKF